MTMNVNVKGVTHGQDLCFPAKDRKKIKDTKKLDMICLLGILG